MARMTSLNPRNTQLLQVRQYMWKSVTPLNAMETENGRVWKAREDTSTRTLAFEIGKSDSDAAYIHAVHETVKVPVEETINAMAGMKLPHRLRN